jgi:FlaA1/EpsC-like NDP-sugar epimerase
MESNEVSERAAAEAELAALRSQRAALAERATQPWWYDALLGLLLFGFIASYSVHDNWVTLAAVAVFLLCLRGMMTLYRRLTGFWVDGFRRGPTRRAIVVWVVVVLAVLGTGFAAEERWRGAMVVAGAVLGVAVVLVSRWWTRIYVAELRGQS